MNAIEKLRESSHLDDDKWTLETGDVVCITGTRPSDPNAVNWGEQWRRIADEIEAEIAANYLPLPVDRNGETIRIGDEVWFHDEPDADPHIVRGYGMTNGRDVDVYINHADEGWCPNTVTVPDVLVHRKPDPLKELLKDFAYKVCDLNVSDDDIARYADRIRELTGGAE